MSRRAEPGILFYRQDVGTTTHKKIKLLFQECGAEGYWIWQNIIQYSYKINGYFFSLNDADEVALFADDWCKLPLDKVMSTIDVCIKRKLFDKDVADKYKVLTNDRIQENYMEATAERRRKGTTIEMVKEYLLVTIAEDKRNIKVIPVNNANLPRNNNEVPSNNPDEEETTATRVPDPQKELKATYKKLDKTLSNVNSFVLHAKPQFIEPYVDLWNFFAAKNGLVQVKDITDVRRDKFKTRMTEKSFDFWEIIKIAGKSNFLLGHVGSREDKKAFKITFDWIIKNQTNYTKVLEGHYNNDETPSHNQDEGGNDAIDMLDKLVKEREQNQ